MEEATLKVKKSIKLRIADVLEEKGYLFGSPDGYLKSVDNAIEYNVFYLLKKVKENKSKFLGLNRYALFGSEKYLYRTELLCSIQLHPLGFESGGHWYIKICGEGNIGEVKQLTLDIANSLGVDTKDFSFVLMSYKTITRYIEPKAFENYFK